ncbi:sensor histidine kinase [Sulfuricystis thermophila]|uniref:sensor histidine kinase n=1 Tax=Sulfuricystis thermophila TaxID=2496847 RepID=UPI0024DF5661|nr:sensor histidine kinase [Sulfuricystis thermophila]
MPDSPPAEKPRRPSVFSDPHPAPNSLFGEILDWMLAPLLLVWPFSITVTYQVAVEIVDQVYDRVLVEHLGRALSGVRVTAAGVEVTLPPAQPAKTDDSESDSQFYQVALAEGELIAGEADLPPLKGGDVRTLGKTHFRDGQIQGEPVRIAYQLLPSPDDARPILVQAAETRNQRKALTSQIISSVLLPQFAIIPLAVVLVWLGLTRGLAPLTRLQERIRSRRPDDLSPIDLSTVPEELQPMISAFNQMMARLEDNLAAQQRFIAAAAHQLKTPLTGLKTQTELALRETDASQLKEYLRRIAAGVERASRMTYQLLNLARAEASHDVKQPMVRIDLESLVREVTIRYVPRALERNIDLGFEIQAKDQPMPWVSGVRVLLAEMIDNLIDNAIKYTPVGGTVTVRLIAAAQPVLEIEDTGIGIPVEERERIFERFYRTLGTDAEGSGLGLAIVREIADLHHIQIEIGDNPAGSGSLFRLTFPATLTSGG